VIGELTLVNFDVHNPMRVVITSDTHYHPSYQRTFAQLISDIAAQKPDCVIVAGDVGETIYGFEQMLTLLEALPCPRLILAGNHDVWENNGHSSRQLWETVLPQHTRDHGAIWLEDENWTQNGLGICGTLGWYDYSARNPAIPWTLDQYALAKGQYNNDGNYIDWPWSDIAFASQIGDAFETRLTALSTDSTVREILVVTHVPPFSEAITYRPDNYGWQVGHAYFYNLTLGERIAAHNKVSHVVSGHTHTAIQTTIERAHGRIDMQIIGSNYGRPVFTVIDYP
jgi:predicted phosphohydrolase